MTVSPSATTTATSSTAGTQTVTILMVKRPGSL
jgi:hypothetical protein